jgi:pyruvate formate lyase activating enzyme
MTELQGWVFNIQRFSIHDGPGIRTTVFLKGCSLNCFWCHNPEGIKGKKELRYYDNLCIGCGDCAAVCPEGAQVMEQGGHVFYRDKCTLCGKCVEVCPSGALEWSARRMAVSEVMKQVMADKPFYRSSAGGMTLSGGEPLVQLDFAYALLEACRADGVHTAIETAGNYPWSSLERVLPLTDLVMMDIKHLDREKHRQTTGAGIELILENARRLIETDKPVIFRIPVIPGVNDSAREIGDIRDFVQGLKEKSKAPISLELLPFHPLASSKYSSLGLDNPIAGLKSLDTQVLEQLRSAARLN